MSAAKAVLVERDGAVLTVTLNRPEALNALDDALLDGLLAAWDQAARTDVRAVVLTGAGRAFCAGADLRAPARTPDELLENQRRRYSAQVLAMAALPKPIVAAVNGPAVGAGLGLACAADIRIASASATFLPAFARIGAVPDTGASFSVPRLIGAGRAFDWFTSERRLDAGQALAWGLVTEVIPDTELLDRARTRAAELAALPVDGVALTKSLLAGSFTSSLDQQVRREERAQAEAASSPERAMARQDTATTL